MTRRKSMIGAFVLCALSLCAFGAANAAATVGLTAVECQAVTATTGHFSSSHCETPEVAGSNFDTVAFPLNESKEIAGEAITTSVLTGTVALSKVKITCTKATTTGKVTNVTPGTEMQAHGTEAVTKYEECEAHLESKTALQEACEVESISGTAGQKGIVETVKLTSTTGPEHKVTFKVESGVGNLAEFNILAVSKTGLPCSLPKSKVSVSGELIGKASTTKHSLLQFTGEGSLKANGAAATYTGENVGFTSANHELTVGLTTIE